MACMNAIPFHREVPDDDIHYPYSDGQPMAESDLHREEMVYLIQALQEHFRDTPDVYVAGNLFLYYEKGVPSAVVAPDLFVVYGVPKGPRKSYKLWHEGGRVPSLVVEVTSDTTREEDLSEKKDRYRRLGVEEYILFDPLGDYLSPRLQGLRLVSSRYVKMRPEKDGSLVSRTTGVTFRVEGAKGQSRLRLIETATGEILPRFEEMVTDRQAAQERVRAMEEELARLRSELARRPDL
jgi:Uma2 family endonuclease